jgi:DNA-directed RNA polymerase specialized sigma24 family protein
MDRDDGVGECLLALCRAARLHCRREHPVAWFPAYATLRMRARCSHLWRLWKRRARVWRPDDGDARPEPVSRDDWSARRMLAREELARVRRRLRPAAFALLWARYSEGKTLAELAGGVSQQAVAKRIDRLVGSLN